MSKRKGLGFWGQLVGLLILGLVLVDCSGSSGEATPTQAPTEAPTEANITLSLTDTADVPVEGAIVKLSGSQEFETTTGADGTARYTKLAPGQYVLQASKDGRSHQPITLEVSAGDSVTEAAVLRAVKEFALIGHLVGISDYRFNNSVPGPEITVQQGDLVRLVVSVPENDIAHAVAIDEFGVDSPTVGRGETTVVDFVAGRAGEFYYYCPLPSHRTLGMEGKFVVEP